MNLVKLTTNKVNTTKLINEQIFYEKKYEKFNYGQNKHE